MDPKRDKNTKGISKLLSRKKRYNPMGKIKKRRDNYSTQKHNIED